MRRTRWDLLEHAQAHVLASLLDVPEAQAGDAQLLGERLAALLSPSLADELTELPLEGCARRTWALFLRGALFGWHSSICRPSGPICIRAPLVWSNLVGFTRTCLNLAARGNMALIDLWKKNRTELSEKKIQQVISFAGDGKLSDGAAASEELREFLRNVPSDLLGAYMDQCLKDPFPNSGFALQDLVNEVGRRLDYTVSPGRYRGTSGHSGHDGIWSDGQQHSVVVEVKTTDAYRIDLDTIAKYRQSLSKEGHISLERSSMLVVVGREDTGDLEAQIRGSRHAWDMRVVSVEALLRMLKLKEEVEDPSILKRIHEILIPREFTRLDPIIEIAFAAVEDVKHEPETEDEDEVGGGDSKKFTPSAFHAECVARIEQRLGLTLVKQSRASFASPDDKVRVSCAVSRFHEKSKRYWFAFHSHQGDFLGAAETGYAAFGCGDASTLFLIPFAEFKPRLDSFNKTERPSGFYWHVKIRKTPKAYVMVAQAGEQGIDISRYKI